MTDLSAVNRQLGLLIGDEITESDRVRAIIQARPDLFPRSAGFEIWVLDNWRIWKAFERRAHRLWDAGARHVGGRLIGETIRYLTWLKERSRPDTKPIFKVNDHAWPSCTRLYMLVHVDRKDLFETRSSSKRLAMVTA